MTWWTFNRNQFYSLINVAALLSIGVASPTLAVTWETQAERLQMVSAAMLDAEPMLAPVEAPFHVALRSVLSVLPKMNATVGAKTEQPPTSPVHTVPTLELAGSRNLGFGVGSLRSWAGYLPEQAAKSANMTAICVQKLWGLSLAYSLETHPEVRVRTELGSQSSSTLVSGGITEPEANDKFAVTSRIDFVSMTFSPQRLKSLWLQGQLAQRRVATKFEIPNDNTTFEFVDQSKITQGDAASQIATGYEFNNGISVAAGYLVIPQRVSMPRFLIGYHMTTESMSRSLVAKN